MKLHERFFIVEEARHKLGSAFMTIRAEYELTYAEAFCILAEELASIAKFALRAERHPDKPGTPADEGDEPEREICQGIDGKGCVGGDLVVEKGTLCVACRRKAGK